MYAKDISKKIKSVKQDKQKKGLFIGGKAPYGYKLSPEKKNTLIIDPEAAGIVKMIFQMALEGKSCREIAVKMNERNIPPPAVYANLNTSVKGPYSGLWSAERISYTLKNQMYIGDMVQGITKKVNYKSKKCIKTPKEHWIIVNNTHPAIIEKDEFYKAQLLINSRKSTRMRTYDYLLKGLVFCKECGYPLGVINRELSGGKAALYFVCRTYQRFTEARRCSSHCVRVDTVTEAVINDIKELCVKYTDKHELKQIAESIINECGTNGGQEVEINLLKGRIGSITSNMDKLFEERINEVLDELDFSRFYKKLKNERDSLQSKIKILQSRTVSNEDLKTRIDDLIERFTVSIDTNRELLCSMVQKIELTEDKEIHIHYRFKDTIDLLHNPKGGLCKNSN